MPWTIGGYPLEFSLYSGYNSGMRWIHSRRRPDWLASPAILSVFSHSSRWRDAELYFPTQPESSKAFSIIKGCIPMLRRLEFKLRHVDNFEPESVLDAFEFAPQLREVSLGYRVSPSILKLPWDQLTTCSVRCSINDCLETLRRNHQLYAIVQYGSIEASAGNGISYTSSCLKNRLIRGISKPGRSV